MVRGRNLKGWAEKSGKDTCRIDNLCFSCVSQEALAGVQRKHYLRAQLTTKTLRAQRKASQA